MKENLDSFPLEAISYAKVTSASRSGRHYHGKQTDTVLWALHLQLTGSMGKGREVVIMAASV